MSIFVSFGLLIFVFLCLNLSTPTYNTIQQNSIVEPRGQSCSDNTALGNLMLHPFIFAAADRVTWFLASIFFSFSFSNFYRGTYEIGNARHFLTGSRLMNAHIN